ncbi:MAG: YibE/F family protein [Elusimicrobia bacterium]|nr:YibE/F family protein [Elusimicrobiota bacterium]
MSIGPRLVFLVLFALAASARDARPGIAPESEYVKARVLKVLNFVPPDSEGSQKLAVEVLGGTYSGMILNVRDRIWDDEAYNTRLSAGDLLTLKITAFPGSPLKAYVMGYYRQPWLYPALLLFLVLFVALTGLKRITGLLAVILNTALFLAVAFPLIRRGFPAAYATIAVTAAGILGTAALVLGTGRKFLSAASGAVCGVLTAALLTIVFIDMMHIQGMFSWDARMLLVASQFVKGWNFWDLQGLVVAGIMVACTGAAVDIAVNIASACNEVVLNSPGISSGDIWRAGMSVGRDIISTMLNSLILAFMGVFMPLVMVFEVMGTPFIKVMNFEFFSIFMMSALISSIALVATVPATAYIASRLYRR